MTRKDYIKIAKAIKTWKSERLLSNNNDSNFNEVDYLVNEFIFVLSQDNPKFNRTKFREYIYD